MAAAVDMIIQAQPYRVNPPAMPRLDNGEVQRAGQRLRAAESQSQAAAQNTRSAQVEEQQARRNLQAAQAEEQRAGERLRAAQADSQKSRQPAPVQMTGGKINILA